MTQIQASVLVQIIFSDYPFFMYASISTPQSLLIKQQVALSSIGFLPSSLATHYDMNCTNTSFCHYLPLFIPALLFHNHNMPRNHQQMAVFRVPPLYVY